MFFKDQNGQKLVAYTPYYGGEEGSNHEQRFIAANEELIGVYGTIKSNIDWFTSFGFIVKVYKDE